MRRTVVFDLDGTIADTSGDLIAAANAALAEMGHAPQLTPGTDNATAFAGGRAMLRLAAMRLGQGEDAAEVLVERGYPLLLKAYGAAIDTHTTLYPGAVAAVERLRGQGASVSICTNKPEGLAHTLVGRLGIAPLFDALIGADTLPVRKPDPAPLHAAIARAAGDAGAAVLIGDTVTDRETARAAGIPCVLVTFGPLGRDVADLAPEGLLNHYDDLDRILSEVLP